MKKRCWECLIALMNCAIPLVSLGQGPAGETVLLSSEAPTPRESSPSHSTSLPPSPALWLDEEPNLEVMTSEAPIESELIGSELATPQTAIPFGYNLGQSNTTWLVGDGNDFGILSFESFPTLTTGKNSGMATGMGFHFLGGPIRTDMPPRLFDFQIGFQQRKWSLDTLGYDVSVRVGVFSDFEGSVRKGVRFPGHVVGYYRCNPIVDLALGIEYLDRDDISLLPVAGMIVTPRNELRLELVFPRPRVDLQISPTQSLYLAGELGGGTWAIERTTMTNDVVTYRDLRLLLGISSRDDEGDESGLEIGYVFGRDLSYRSGFGDFAPHSTLLMRLTHRH